MDSKTFFFFFLLTLETLRFLKSVKASMVTHTGIISLRNVLMDKKHSLKYNLTAPENIDNVH